MSAPKKGGAALAIAGAVFVAAPISEKWEGFAPTPYYDPAHIKTGCFGETEDPAYLEDRVYSRTECGKQLRARLARDYAPKLLACLPQLEDPRRVYVFGALLDASYNAGPAAVCGSRMAIAVRAGQWTAACNGLDGWYETTRWRGKVASAAAMKAKGYTWTGSAWRKWLPGLHNRRLDEKSVCLKGGALP